MKIFLLISFLLFFSCVSTAKHKIIDSSNLIFSEPPEELPQVFFEPAKDVIDALKKTLKLLEQYELWQEWYKLNIIDRYFNKNIYKNQ